MQGVQRGLELKDLRGCGEDVLVRLRGAAERLVFYCRTTSASTAPRTPKDVLPLRICDYHFAPCQPLVRAISGWI